MKLELDKRAEIFRWSVINSAEGFVPLASHLLYQRIRLELASIVFVHFRGRLREEMDEAAVT